MPKRRSYTSRRLDNRSRRQRDQKEMLQDLLRAAQQSPILSDPENAPLSALLLVCCQRLIDRHNK